ncbi:SapB/AmfS family lanthipeptide [Spirillospora sp. NPDC049024]|nr:SapB/AmfS family lanthipeptide [Actinomadura sp. K4S16]
MNTDMASILELQNLDVERADSANAADSNGSVWECCSTGSWVPFTCGC